MSQVKGQGDHGQNVKVPVFSISSESVVIGKGHKGQGQGHKGQGQKCNFFNFDPLSTAKGHRSQSQGQGQSC